MTAYIKRGGATRSRVLEATDSYTGLAASFNTDPIPVSPAEYGFAQVKWSGFEAFNGRIIWQASDNLVDWEDLGGADGGIVLDTEDGSQGWEMTILTFKFLRMEFTANNVATGDMSWTFKGYA